MHKYDGNDGLKARVSYATCNFTSAKPVTWIKIKKLESKAAVISHQAVKSLYNNTDRKTPVI